MALKNQPKRKKESRLKRKDTLKQTQRHVSMYTHVNIYASYIAIISVIAMALKTNVFTINKDGMSDTVVSDNADAYQENTLRQACIKGDDVGCKDNLREESDVGDVKLRNDDACLDSHQKCAEWAARGECMNYPQYMFKFCQRSCDKCLNDKTRQSREMGVQNFDYGIETVKHVKSDMATENTLIRGIEQKIVGSEREIRATEEIINLSNVYLTNSLHYHKGQQQKYILEQLCVNKHELCSFWAAWGECDKNPAFMLKSCSLACLSCENHLILHRCPIDPDAPSALPKPGDLNNMFERLVTYDAYQPKVLSRPFLVPEDEGMNSDNVDYKIGPWVIMFDSFLSEEECDRLINAGKKLGFHRSLEVGNLNGDGSNERKVDDARTSENAWCDEELCDNDPIIAAITKRIADVTNIPVTNQERLQILRYHEGQYYKSHHDYIPYHAVRQPGVRLLTFFLYLNDVEKGGSTKFDLLDNLVVTPKKGRALVWPSVDDKNPSMIDLRTEHEALPVEKGVKYGANAWIHARDFRTSWNNQCI